MDIGVKILLILLLIIIVAIIMTFIYYRSAAFQQSLTITIPFEETYRYVPNLNQHQNYKIDTIKVVVTGAIKKNSASGATITPGDKIKHIIDEAVIQPYKNCLIVQEANTFLATEGSLKRCPITKNPTVENLSIMFFSKLAPLMPKIGAQLISVRLASAGVTASNSRYKMSNYTM